MASHTYTHVGCRPHVGYVHCGASLWGHTMPKPGRRHALNSGPDGSALFVALCGEKVALAAGRDDYGDEIPPNVRRVGDPEARPVTCRRCLKRLAARAD